MILASASPRRADILRTLEIEFEVVPADIDEAPFDGESPRAHVERMARAKALAVAERFPEESVLAGDTVVVLDGVILGKPSDPRDALRMLLELQGRTHHVFSALTLVMPRRTEGEPPSVDGVEVTAVTFRRFDESVARAYVGTGEPLDKAGAYGIQGMGAALVHAIEGDYTGVVGLPVPLLVRLLERAGIPYRFGSPISEAAGRGTK